MTKDLPSHRNQTGTDCGLQSLPAVTSQMTDSFLSRDSTCLSTPRLSLAGCWIWQSRGDEEDSSEERSRVERRPDPDAVPRAARKGYRAPVHRGVLGHQHPRCVPLRGVRGEAVR